jgi:hypothetical protein
MGDRAYARVTVADKHLDHVAGTKRRGDTLSVRQVIEFAGFTEVDHYKEEGTTDFADEEANWGGADMYNDLVACGVPFMGSNAPGDKYDASEWAYSGRGKEVLSAATSEGCLVCTVDSATGRPYKASLANVRRYLRTLKTAQRKMGVPCV